MCCNVDFIIDLRVKITFQFLSIEQCMFCVSIFDFVLRMYVVQIYISNFCANEQRSMLAFTLKVCTNYLISTLTHFYAIISHFSWTNIIFHSLKFFYLLHCLRLFAFDTGPFKKPAKQHAFGMLTLSNVCQIAVKFLSKSIELRVGTGKCQVCFRHDPVYMGENCSGVF